MPRVTVDMTDKEYEIWRDGMHAPRGKRRKAERVLAAAGRRKMRAVNTNTLGSEVGLRAADALG